MIPDRAKTTMCPVFQQLLISFATELDTNDEPTVEQLRARYTAQVQSYNGPLDHSSQIEDLAISGRKNHTIALRVFRSSHTSHNAPAVLYLHGGGWVLGNLDTHAGICSDVAKLTGATVIAVDYRLSPEHICPDALNDCVDALRYISNHASDLGIDRQGISLMGDSAGGNLCAATSMVCRGSDINILSQVLIYPGLGADTTLPSYEENEDIPGLSRDDMRYYFQTYIGEINTADELSAPLTANDVSALPPSYISVAEFDPLRDDGVEYARLLNTAGVPNELSVEKGLGHSWLWVRGQSDVAKQSLLKACQFLNQAFANPQLLG